MVDHLKLTAIELKNRRSAESVEDELEVLQKMMADCLVKKDYEKLQQHLSYALHCQKRLADLNREFIELGR